MKKFNLLVLVLIIGAVGIKTTSQAYAFVTTTGGDGYIPVIYQDKIFNIFHHQNPSRNPLIPTYDIDCFDKVTGIKCPNYPKYFSSAVGSSGSLGIGSPGTADISTTYFPQTSSLFGSKIFYPAQRVGDNGIACFDLSSNTNCGYIQLGSIAWSGLVAEPAEVDGINQEGNRLYSIGNDMRFYCLDVSNPLAPTACVGQPYSFNTGVPALHPYTGNRFEVPNNAAGPNLGKIYVDMNYRTDKVDPGPAQLTCFDSVTNARCAGWTSATINFSGPAPNLTYSRSLVHILDTSGNFIAVCANTVIAHSPQCFNAQTMASVSPPPNFLSGITSRDSPNITYIWDHIDSGYNTIYFAISAGGPGNYGEAYCYDFTTQNYCAGFGNHGVKAWDGLDGGVAVHGGITKDYGYAIDGNCIYGLGDSGILWSFKANTGEVAPGLLICHANEVLGASISSSTPKLPDTGFAPRTKTKEPLMIASIIGAASGFYLVYLFGKRNIS